MKFSNLDLQEIQKTGAAYIPVSLTYVDSNKNVKDSLLCVHDDKGVLDNGKNVVHQIRAGGSPCLQAWGGSSRPIDTKATQYVDLQFIDFRCKICYNFNSEKR